MDSEGQIQQQATAAPYLWNDRKRGHLQLGRAQFLDIRPGENLRETCGDLVVHFFHD
jgi:hypothetical protein